MPVTKLYDYAKFFPSQNPHSFPNNAKVILGRREITRSFALLKSLYEVS